jgi:hypothetical protein
MRQGPRHLLLAGTPLCKGTLFVLELDARGLMPETAAYFSSKLAVQQGRRKATFIFAVPFEGCKQSTSC